MDAGVWYLEQRCGRPGDLGLGALALADGLQLEQAEGPRAPGWG